MRLPLEWTELIASLISHRVRFLLVGAHALAAHGRPRATQDLDLLIEPSRANCRRLGQALGAFGYPGLAAEWEQFTEPNRMATLGREPLRVDLLTEITGVTFSEAWKGRLVLHMDGFDVPCIGLAALKKNKRATGRTKDRLDLELLAEVAAASTRRRPTRKPAR